MNSIELFNEAYLLLKQAETNISKILNSPVKLSFTMLKCTVKTDADLQKVIADVMGVTWHSITGDKKDSTSVTGRQLYCYFCRIIFPGKNKTEISRDLKYPNHTSVITSLRRINNLIDTKDEYIIDAANRVNEKIYRHEV